jgi:hypothetical protein
MFTDRKANMSLLIGQIPLRIGAGKVPSPGDSDSGSGSEKTVLLLNQKRRQQRQHIKKRQTCNQEFQRDLSGRRKKRMQWLKE